MELLQVLMLSGQDALVGEASNLEIFVVDWYVFHAIFINVNGFLRFVDFLQDTRRSKIAFDMLTVAFDHFATILESGVEIIQLFIARSTLVELGDGRFAGRFNASGECLDGFVILLLLVIPAAKLLIFFW